MDQGHPFEGVAGDVVASTGPVERGFPGQSQVPGRVLPVAAHQQQVAELEVSSRRPLAPGLALQHPQEFARGFPFDAGPAA